MQHAYRPKLLPYEPRSGISISNGENVQSCLRYPPVSVSQITDPSYLNLRYPPVSVSQSTEPSYISNRNCHQTSLQRYSAPENKTGLLLLYFYGSLKTAQTLYGSLKNGNNTLRRT